MYFAKVHSAQAELLSATRVDIEVDVSRGLHSIIIVGLPDKSVGEAKERMASAIKHSGFGSPKQKNHKLVISLAPAHIQKSGTSFDVPIALAYLLATNEIKSDVSKKLFIGELSLDGKLRAIHGIIPIITYAQTHNFTEIFIPAENISETIFAKDITVYGAHTLKEIIDHLSGNAFIQPTHIPTTKREAEEIKTHNTEPEYLFDEIMGSESAKRGLLIAASGGHNTLLFGPPGVGKTALATGFKELLPRLSTKQQLESSSIYSFNSKLCAPILDPPFRAPHHTASYAAILGGGHNLRIGEITMAHNGVLFLDELPEFDQRVIDALRQPLEEKGITIARARGSQYFPANFVLVATMNPCPCGYYKTGIRPCVCPQNAIVKYRRKISGPILDRIDLWIPVHSVTHKKLLQSTDNNNQKGNKLTAVYRTVTMDARAVQINRQGKLNAELTSREVREICCIDQPIKEILEAAAQKMNVSPRSLYKILKIARTIADLESSEKIKESHTLEAMQYRSQRPTD